MADGSLFMAVAVDDGAVWTDWLVARISAETMDGILDSRFDLRAAFTSLRVGPPMTGDFGGGEGEPVELRTLAEEPSEDWLPGEGVTCSVSRYRQRLLTSLKFRPQVACGLICVGGTRR
jgi:hypothetical protein